MEKKWELKSISDWRGVASELALLRTGQDVILLEGPLGAGKTTAVKAMLSAMGFDHVSSPTYALHHEYETKFGIVDHIDLFRIQSLEDWIGTGLEDLFLKNKGLIILEWPSQIINFGWSPARVLREWHVLNINIGIEKFGRTVLLSSL